MKEINSLHKVYSANPIFGVDYEMEEKVVYSSVLIRCNIVLASSNKNTLNVYWIYGFIYFSVLTFSLNLLKT